MSQLGASAEEVEFPDVAKPETDCDGKTVMSSKYPTRVFPKKAHSNAAAGLCNYLHLFLQHPLPQPVSMAMSQLFINQDFIICSYLLLVYQTFLPILTLPIGLAHSVSPPSTFLFTPD